MTKIIIVFALVCVAIVSARAFGFNRQFGGNRRAHGGRDDQWATKLCDNASLAQAFLNKTRQFILDLQANGSYTEVLQERAQQIAYVQNNTIAALLSSNCTEYFKGLSNARKADKQAEDQEEQLEQNAARLFKQIVQSLVGLRNFSDDDF